MPSRQELLTFVRRFYPVDSGRSMRLVARAAWEFLKRRGDFSLELVEELVNPGATVIDAGASWGLYSARLADLVGPAGAVHAFEPDPDSAASLFAIRGRRSNLFVNAAALSDSDGTATLHIPLLKGRPRNTRGSLAVPLNRSATDHRTHEVVTMKLDSVVFPAGRAVDFIKCDVEGHELAVLRGGEQLLKRDHPTLLVEIEQRHQARPVSQVFGFLLSLGYRGYLVHSKGLETIDEFDLERDQLQHLRGSYADRLPSEYIHDFVFARPELPMDRFLCKRKI